MKRILFILLCVCQCALASTGELYQVEVIIFENRQLTQADLEKWPNNPALPEVERAKNLSQADEQLIPYQLLPKSLLNLNTEASNIAHDPNYNLLLHVSWLQPLSYDHATPVHLYSKDNFTDVHQLQPYDLNKQWKLDGVIAIKKSKYFEIDADLILNKHKPTPLSKSILAEEKTEMLLYRLKQQRRMRESELHFIDNPVFGVLIKITPASKLVKRQAINTLEAKPNAS